MERGGIEQRQRHIPLADIRRASRRANALAASAGRLASEAYRAALAEVFDYWMAKSVGQQQLVCSAVLLKEPVSPRAISFVDDPCRSAWHEKPRGV